jgi:hypothetical protein
MNKNIYIDLADKLDSAGLFLESDDLLKVFSSSTSMIKTAQSGNLDTVLIDTDKLDGWTSLISKTAGVSGAAGLTTFLISFAGRQKELRNTYEQNVEVEAASDLYNAKTVDQVKINKLKQEHAAALKSNKPKVEIEIQLPNNKSPYNPGDPNTYTVEKYKVLEKKEINSKDKSGNPITKEIKNSILNQFLSPDMYVVDLTHDGIQETIPVKKTTNKKIIPKDQLDKYYEQQSKNNKAALRYALISTGLFTGASIGYFLLDFGRFKNGLSLNIKQEYRKFIFLHKQSKKTQNDKNNLLQEFTNSLNSLLSRCDGINTLVPASFPKEKFRDNILKVFKKEIRFGESSDNSDRPKSNSNSRSTTPSIKPRSQNPRNPQNKPAPPPGASGQNKILRDEL